MLVNKTFAISLSIVCGLLALSGKVHAAVHESVLFTFSGADGSNPVGNLTLDPAGNLYGTTLAGGGGSCSTSSVGCGTVFQLSPGPKGKWTHTVLHKFGAHDGAMPEDDLFIDAAGNMYGSTEYGGSLCLGVRGGCSIIFELSPGAGGKWVYRILHEFHGQDGAYPQFRMVGDTARNLYGTTAAGGNLSCGEGFGCGVVFKLTPGAIHRWAESVLYAFSSSSDGNRPNGVTFDKSGNLYSATDKGGSNNYGTVFELTPHKSNWSKKILYTFDGTNGAYPQSELILMRRGICTEQPTDPSTMARFSS
jgi:hypothetical protein